MRLLKLLPVALLFCVLASCSEDDNGNASGKSNQMAYYTSRTVTTLNDPSIPPYHAYFKRYILNNKFFSFTEIDPLTLQEYPATQDYFYTNGRLTSVGGGFSLNSFSYDAQGRFIASDLMTDTMEEYHRRVVYVSDNVSYVEDLTLASTDPATEIIQRAIVEFDGQDNIIKAGLDANLDGIMDGVNLFTYVNNNLTHAQLHDVGIYNYTYSNVVNNMSVLYDNTYGKKMSRLLWASHYAMSHEVNVAEHSVNLQLQALQLGSYEVLPNGLYKKRTEASHFDGGQSLNITEFFFY